MCTVGSTLMFHHVNKQDHVFGGQCEHLKPNTSDFGFETSKSSLMHPKLPCITQTMPYQVIIIVYKSYSSIRKNNHFCYVKIESVGDLHLSIHIQTSTTLTKCKITPFILCVLAKILYFTSVYLASSVRNSYCLPLCYYCHNVYAKTDAIQLSLK